MKKTILFIDDDQRILNIGDMFIKRLGHKVLLVESGQKAIDILKENNGLGIDFILLDIMMPEVDGFGVLEFLKDSNIQIPVVLQTGVMDDNDLKKAKKLGAVDCITKPYTRKDVEYLIKKYSL
jgi:CheY-like chemotaxis protein